MAALLAMSAFAALAMGQAVEDEYGFEPNVPQVNETDQQGGAGGASGSGGGSGPASGAPSDDAVPTLGSDSSGGGGAPLLLIVIAAVAAACAGVAVWRLRQASASSERKSSQGAKPSTSAASETQL